MSSCHLIGAASFEVDVYSCGIKMWSLVQENRIFSTKKDYAKLNHEYVLDIRKKTAVVVLVWTPHYLGHAEGRTKDFKEGFGSLGTEEAFKEVSH